MQTAIAQISPEILASALSQVDGRRYGTATPQEQDRLADRVGDVLEDEALKAELLHVLAAWEEHEFKRPSPLKGRVLMAAGPALKDPWSHLNAELEATGAVFEHPSTLASAWLRSAKVPSPAVLGFEDAGAVEPVSSEAVVAADRLLLELEEHLAKMSAHRSSWVSRAFDAVFDHGTRLSFRTHQVAGFTQVEAWEGSKKRLQVRCLLSGDTLYFLAILQDRVAVKDKFGLGSPLSMVGVANAFRDEAEAGARAIHELRDLHKLSSSWKSTSGFGPHMG